MNKREALRRQIASLEEKLDKREAKASGNTDDELVKAFRGLQAAVKKACGESYMDDVDTEQILEALPDEEVPGDDMDEMSYMDHEDEMSYMDDMDEMSYMDDEMSYMEDEMSYMDDEDEMYMAEDTEPTQEYLDDVEEEAGSTVQTEDSMEGVARKSYVAKLKKASTRLDRIADYLEKQGNKEMALRVDKIADAIDTRIEQEANNA